MMSHNFISGQQAGPISYSGINYSGICTKKSVLLLSTIIVYYTHRQMLRKWFSRVLATVPD
jgi:hypothetical protein